MLPCPILLGKGASEIMFLSIIAIVMILTIIAIIALSDFSSKPDAKCNWMFGYGSNMDRSHIEIKKNLTVLGKFSF